MPSNKGYEELIKIIRHFLWTKWDGGKGFISTSWSHCIQPRHRGGLGLIDPKTQGFCLAAKWIIRVAKGDEPWKVLVRNRIFLPIVRGKWQGVGWLDKLLHTPYFSIKASPSLQSVWKAWQRVSHLLKWRDGSLQHGFSFSTSSIWWNRHILYHDQPLALSFPKLSYVLSKKGINTVGDLWDFNNLDWLPWDVIRAQLNLNNKYKSFFIFVESLVPPELSMKLCILIQCNFFKD